MENKRRKTLLFSMLVLCICTILIVGGTYALFTDSVTVNNHLEAGNLSVGLYRTSLTEHVLDNTTGLMTDHTNTDEINLVTNSDKLFSMTNAVPTCRYEATIKVSNDGSTAFDYGVRILWEADGNADTNDELLAGQIKITVKSQNLTEDVVFMLDESAGKNVSLGAILKNEAAETFTIIAEFVNDSEYNADIDNIEEYINNNSAMLATLDFDVQVYATQKTSLD